MEVDRARSVVTIEWDDGLRQELPLVEVRLRCPCATCRGLRDRDEDPWPRPGSPNPLGVDGAELVGAWGISFTWNDGHATGIYPWEGLRAWAEAEHAEAERAGAAHPDAPES